MVTTQETMVKKYLPWIYKHAIDNFATIKGYEIDDLVQDTILNVLRASFSYSTDGQFLGWVKLIMVNLVRNKSNRQKLKDNIDQNHDNSVKAYCHILITPSGEDLVLIDSIKEKIRELPSTQKQVFELFLEGYSYKEIAIKTNISLKETETLMTKARKRLKTSCKEYKEVI